MRKSNNGGNYGYGGQGAFIGEGKAKLQERLRVVNDISRGPGWFQVHSSRLQGRFKRSEKVPGEFQKVLGLLWLLQWVSRWAPGGSRSASRVKGVPGDL